jgi:hypothetical protein
MIKMYLQFKNKRMYIIYILTLSDSAKVMTANYISVVFKVDNLAKVAAKLNSKRADVLLFDFKIISGV